MLSIDLAAAPAQEHSVLIRLVRMHHRILGSLLDPFEIEGRSIVSLLGTQRFLGDSLELVALTQAARGRSEAALARALDELVRAARHQ